MYKSYSSSYSPINQFAYGESLNKSHLKERDNLRNFLFFFVLTEKLGCASLELSVGGEALKKEERESQRKRQAMLGCHVYV